MKKLVPYFTPDGRRVVPRGLVVLSAVLAVLVVVLAAVSIRLCFTRAELLSQVEDLETQLYQKGQDYANAQADYAEAESKIDSMRTVLNDRADAIEYIATQASAAMIEVRFIPNNGGRMYHRINCPFLGPYDLITSTVSDKLSAESLGYHSCPLCESQTSSAFQQYCTYSNSVFDLVDLIRHDNSLEWDIAALR